MESKIPDSSKSPEKRPVFRVAPTPSGFLHLGNLYNFLLTEMLCKQKNGILRLRIDDHDEIRTDSRYIEHIFEISNRYGIKFNEGPSDPADFYKNYSQQRKKEKYRNFLKNFFGPSGLLYSCGCSRKDIRRKTAFSGNPGVYHGICFQKNGSLFDSQEKNSKMFPNDGNTAVRFHILKGKASKKFYENFSDPVLWRRDDIPAYHLMTLFEDETDQTDIIVRGEDLYESSILQKYLARAAGLKHFGNVRIYHHPLLKDKNGKKLSKSVLKKIGQPDKIFSEIQTREEMIRYLNLQNSPEYRIL